MELSTLNEILAEQNIQIPQSIVDTFMEHYKN